MNWSMFTQKVHRHYDKINHSPQASAETYYSAAKTKQMMNGDLGEILALLDSAVNKYAAPYPREAANYLSERALVKTQKEMYKEAVIDYDYFEQAMDSLEVFMWMFEMFIQLISVTKPLFICRFPNLLKQRSAFV